MNIAIIENKKYINLSFLSVYNTFNILNNLKSDSESVYFNNIKQDIIIVLFFTYNAYNVISLYG